MMGKVGGKQNRTYSITVAMGAHYKTRISVKESSKEREKNVYALV